MKKITFASILFICFVTHSFSQTIAWSSDLEDLTGWGIEDLDMDGKNWGVYGGGGESFGFNSGAIAFSESWSPDPAPNGTALTPDNLLYTPTFAIAANATAISFKLKVAALDENFFAEKFAVLVYDDADIANTIVSIHEETLTSGGPSSAKDISATIPVSFAGKTIGIVVRHYECTDQNQLLIDDFEVSYTTSLSINENSLAIDRVYPNPVNNILTIDSKEFIDNVIISNQLGQIVHIINHENILNNKINLSNLPMGFYLIKLQAQEKFNTVKIWKE